MPVAKASMEKLILQEEAARKSAALRMWVEKEAAAGLDQHKQWQRIQEENYPV